MTIHAPVPDYAAARASMVDSQLRPEGVNYPPVAEAMAAVKREDCVSDEARDLAYIDRTVPIGEGRMMSAPVVVGKLLTEMTPVAGERALVVGCGTGYSAAVLTKIGVQVIGLECSPLLAGRARALGIEVVEGPLDQGWAKPRCVSVCPTQAKSAPYDLILINGAVEHIPDEIIAQLTDRGRLGTALIDRGISRLAVGRRAGDGFGLHTMADSSAAALPIPPAA